MVYFPITLSVVLSSSLFVALIINSMLTSQFMKVEEEPLTKPKLIRRSLIFLIIGAIFLILGFAFDIAGLRGLNRKSTRLNSSHVRISYAVFCLKKKKE